MKQLSSILLAISLGIYFLYEKYAPHNVVKQTPLKEPGYYSTFSNIFNETQYESIQNFLKNSTFYMNLRVDATVENQFGSRPIGKDGKCDHPLLHSSKNGDRCVVPAKVDTGKHMIVSGGWGAKKEKYDDIIGRLRFFQRVWLEFKDEEGNIVTPEILDVVETENYKKEAEKVCRNKKYILPYQVSSIVSLPGQEVAMHYDFAKFIGADRYSYPMWLLIAMRQSNLFNEYLINQVQGVTYMHDWKNHEKQGGGFYFYPQGPGGEQILVEAEPNRALIIDGSELIHGTQTFIPGTPPQKLSKDIDYYIKYNYNIQRWEVREQKSDNLYNTYTDDEVRISLVWRQQCFDDEDQYQRWLNNEEPLSQDYIFNTLLDNLIDQGKIKEKPGDELEIVQVIMNNYIKFPYPQDSIIPYNYCAISKMVPFLQPLVDLIC